MKINSTARNEMLNTVFNIFKWLFSASLAWSGWVGDNWDNFCIARITNQFASSNFSYQLSAHPDIMQMSSIGITRIELLQCQLWLFIQACDRIFSMSFFIGTWFPTFSFTYLFFYFFYAYPPIIGVHRYRSKKKVQEILLLHWYATPTI